MSIESAKAFIERMNTDAEFAKRALEQRGKEHIASFLKAEEYEFSEEDYKEAFKSTSGCDLGDDSLDKVAGGVFPPCVGGSCW